jgi:hypothetical protein
VSDIDPLDVALPDPPAHQESFDEDPVEFSTPPPRSKKAEREGLPSGYRMRADAHYVDVLTTRRQERADRPERPAVPRAADAVEAEPPAADTRERREPRERRGERVFAQLAEDLATIDASSMLLDGASSDLARRTNLDLVRAHASRAAWLIRANSVLDGVHRAQPRPRTLHTLLGQVRDHFSAEARLHGLRLETHATDWNASVTIDDVALTTGVLGAIYATAALLAQAEGATIRVTAIQVGGELTAIEVSQDAVVVHPSVVGKFFDASWTDRPGGWLAGMAAWSTRVAANRLGGDAHLQPGERRGSILRLGLGRA